MEICGCLEVGRHPHAVRNIKMTEVAAVLVLIACIALAVVYRNVNSWAMPVAATGAAIFLMISIACDRKRRISIAPKNATDIALAMKSEDPNVRARAVSQAKHNVITGQVTTMNTRGGNLLHSLASFKELSKEDAIAQIKIHKAEIDKLDMDGRTPLQIADECGNEMFADLLIAHGAGDLPFHTLAFDKEKGQTAVVYQIRRLANRDINEKEKGPRKRTALHIAYEQQNGTVIKALEDAGAAKYIGDAAGRRPDQCVPDEEE